MKETEKIFRDDILQTANQFFSQKYLPLYELCDKEIGDIGITLYDEHNLFHNNPKRIAQTILEIVKKYYRAKIRELITDKVYTVEFNGFKFYTIYYSNLAYKIFYRDIYYRRIYNPANLSDVIDLIKYYEPIQSPQPETAYIKMPTIYFTDEVYVGGYPVNYYLSVRNHYLPEVITDDLDRTLSHFSFGKNGMEKMEYTIQIIPIPIFSDIALKVAIISIHDNIEAIIYNSAEYELIPYIMSQNGRRTIKIATITVTIRFLIIRMLVNTILHAPSYNQIHAHNKLIKIFSHFSKGKMEKMEKKKMIVDNKKILSGFSTNFYGVNKDLRKLYK